MPDKKQRAVQNALSPQSTKILHATFDTVRPDPESVYSRFPDDQPPPPGVPYPFRPDPFVNNPDVQALLHKILTAAPEIAPRLRNVQVGPTRDILSELPDTIAPDQFQDTNLLGVTNMKTKDVTLNPRLVRKIPQGISLDNTLAHELAHVAGKEDDWAYPIGEAFEAAQRKKY